MRGVAMLLTTLSVLAMLSEVGLITEVARGRAHTHRFAFWLAVLFALALAGWAVPRSIRAWRRIAGEPDPN